MKLLGNVMGKDILEIGCGGGQNSIVLAKWGAKAVGLDLSREQVRHARKLARKEEVNVSFRLGSMEDLGVFSDGRFDIVLSSFAIGYVEDLLRTFQETFRVSRKSGLFVFAVSHPVTTTGRVVRYGKGRKWAVGNYFDRRKHPWKWKVEDGIAYFSTRHRTIQDYFDLVVEAGFQVERILEPEPYHLNELSEQERKEIPYAAEYYLKYYDVWSKVPNTIIFKAKKP